jgi:hypothetical protein
VPVVIIVVRSSVTVNAGNGAGSRESSDPDEILNGPWD